MATSFKSVIPSSTATSTSVKEMRFTHFDLRCTFRKARMARG